MNKVFPLKGAVQNYAWGGKSFIPDLMDIENTDGQPFAEVWLGAHQRGPAQLYTNGHLEALNDWLKKNPEALGEKVIEKFGKNLPYLFKVLDVNKMLSIQSHPTKKAAEMGFARENQAGIPLAAKHRNYKDDNHKPEVMVAMTDFWLLHGFKSEKDIEAALAAVPEFEALFEYYQRILTKEVENKIFHLYKNLMEMPQKRVDEILKPLADRLRPLFEKNKLSKHQADYWAALAFRDSMLADGHFDRGVFSIYIFNLVHLKVGEGIFQDAGIPHAYLEGVNMELMANSDNVFRGGLTVKHVDVQELLEHVVFEPVVPKILTGKTIARGIKVFETPAPDFELSRIYLKDFEAYHCNLVETPETLIVMKGEVRVSNEGEELRLGRGDSFFAPSGARYSLLSDGGTVVFKAAVPIS
ncbi:MAG: mannose-6-phosphate isomerase, class I [Bacteroidota bacterium]